MTHSDDADHPTVDPDEKGEVQGDDPTRATAPPANPPIDEEAEAKGQEQLGKIVGN